MEDQLIDQVAWSSREYLRGPIRGIILRFAGLGATAMKDAAEPAELEWSDQGGLVVFPYHEPWAWMNAPTRRFVDELLEAIFRRHQLDAGIPVIATGGSMGGQQALVFCRYSRHHVVACCANCPVCDLPFHYTERPDLPRTMHHAFGSYGEIGPALREHSPLHLVETMPRIDYLIIHGVKDPAVAKIGHSDPFVAAMRAQGHRVEYRVLPNMNHCGPVDYATMRRMVDFGLEHLLR